MKALEKDSNAEHDQELRQRCDHYLLQNHITSAITLITLRCDSFNYVQHLDELIAEQQLKLLETNFTNEDILAIEERIGNTTALISSVDRIIDKTEEDNNDFVRVLVQQEESYNDTVQEIDQLNIVEQLIEQFAKLIAQMDAIRQQIGLYRQFIERIDCFITQIDNSNDVQWLTDQINNFFKMPRSMENLVCVAGQIREIQYYIIPQMRQAGIEMMGELEQDVLKFKEDIYQDVLLNLIKIWGENLVQLAVSAGEEVFGLQLAEMELRRRQELARADKEIARFVAQQGGMSPSTGTHPMTRPNIDGLPTPAAAGSRSVLQYFDVQAVAEVLHVAELLDHSEETLLSLRQSFQRAVVTKLSLEQLFYHERFHAFYNVVGVISLYMESGSIYSPQGHATFMAELRQQLLGFSHEVSSQSWAAGGRLLSAVEESEGNSLADRLDTFFDGFMDHFIAFLDLIAAHDEPGEGPSAARHELLENVFQCYIVGLAHATTSGGLRRVFERYEASIGSVPRSMRERDNCAMHIVMELYFEVTAYLLRVSRFFDPYTPRPRDYTDREAIACFQGLNYYRPGRGCEVYSHQVFSAINEILYPCILTELFDVHAMANDLSVVEATYICQVAHTTASAARVVHNFLKNHFELGGTSVMVIKDLLSSKINSLVTNTLGHALCGHVKAIYWAMDIGKRYSSKAATEPRLVDKLLEFGRELNEELSFMSLQQRSIILQKELQVIFLEEFFTLLCERVENQSIGHSGYRTLVGDIEQIEGCVYDIDIGSVPQDEDNGKPIRQGDVRTPEEENDATDAFRSHETLKAMLARVIQQGVSSGDTSHAVGQTIQNQITCLASCQAFCAAIGEIFTGEGVNGPEAPYRVQGSAYSVLSSKLRVSSGAERDAHKAVMRRVTIYGQ